jgi:hypothetical protein
MELPTKKLLMHIRTGLAITLLTIATVTSSTAILACSSSSSTNSTGGCAVSTPA